jgi:hypothetical protein
MQDTRINKCKTEKQIRRDEFRDQTIIELRKPWAKGKQGTVKASQYKFRRQFNSSECKMKG